MMPGDVADTWGDVTLLKALTGYVPDTPPSAAAEFDSARLLASFELLDIRVPHPEGDIG
jgi:hypothetical protein